MPTDNPRFSITVDPELDNNIETYWHNTRAKSKTQAVVSLIEKGLANLNKEQIKKSPAPEGTEDKKVSVEEMKSLLRALGFLDANGNLSDDDMKFLDGVFDLLDAWFTRKRHQ